MEEAISYVNPKNTLRFTIIKWNTIQCNIDARSVALNTQASVTAPLPASDVLTAEGVSSIEAVNLSNFAAQRNFINCGKCCWCFVACACSRNYLVRKSTASSLKWFLCCLLKLPAWFCSQHNGPSLQRFHALDPQKKLPCASVTVVFHPVTQKPLRLADYHCLSCTTPLTWPTASTLPNSSCAVLVILNLLIIDFVC